MFNTIELLGYDIDYIQDETVKADINPAEYHGIICNAFFQHNDISDYLNLKFIQLTSAGYDRVPLGYIKEHNIKLFNAGSIYSKPIAEFIILKILEIYKKSRFFYDNQRHHSWTKHRGLLELTGKTACIIGMGSIGKEAAKRLKAFETHIIGIDKIEIQCSDMDEYHDISELESILPQSDIVILALPLNDETKYLIDAKMLGKIKETAVIINVSRGGIIDEDALITALQQGRVLGAGLDVFEEEPLDESSPLWDMEEILITPHNAFVSDRVDERLHKLIIQNLQTVQSKDAS